MVGDALRAPTPRVHEGVLEAWIETGTEGAVWTLAEDGPGDSYARMRPIETGDHLTVWLPDGRTVFEGVAAPDRRAGWQEYPLNPGHGQAAALGLWIHWTQRGWDPDAWAGLFLLHDPPLRARLVKRAAAQRRAWPTAPADGPRVSPSEYAAWVADRLAVLEREAAEREARWREAHPEEYAAVMRQLERVRTGEATLDEALLALGGGETRSAPVRRPVDGAARS
jgi:hypothetical protein